LEFYYALYIIPCFINVCFLGITINDELFWQGLSKQYYWVRDKQERTKTFLFNSLIPIYNLLFVIYFGVMILLRWFFPEEWLK